MRKPYTKVQYKDGNKKCTSCGVYKNTSEFHKYSKSQDGLKPFCKPCVKNYDLKEHDPKRKYPRKYADDGKILCQRCMQYLNKSKFQKSKGGSYKGKVYEKYTYCKECSKYMGHLGTYRKYGGMTPEDYLRIEAEQNGVCKICGNDNNGRRLMVDHDHNCCPGSSTCGKCTRGLLCKNCNWALGNAKDDVILLNKMISYLESYDMQTRV